mgnify:FL=1
MPFIPGLIGAAIGSIGTAIGGITLSGLATGAMVAGTAISAIGVLTGSKTLTKIGMGLGLAGGVGGLAAGMTGTGALTLGSIGKNMTQGGKSGLLSTNNIDNILSAQTKGSKSASDLIGFEKQYLNPGNKGGSVVGSNFEKQYLNPSSIASSTAGEAYRPDADLEKNYLQRANETLAKHNTLTQYNTAANVLGGMGDAYVTNEAMNLRRDLVDKQLTFDQQSVDRLNAGNVPLGINVSPSVMRNTNTYKPLLQRNQ